MEERIGIAVIGCGGIGTIHLESLRRLRDLSVVATVDIVAKRARG